MLTINGKNNSAICYTDSMDDESRRVLSEICEKPYSEASRIRIMPDVHYDGHNSVVGFTMTMPDYIVMELEYAAGCGMYCAKLGQNDIDLCEFDRICHEIPHGSELWAAPIAEFDFGRLKCSRQLLWKNMYLHSLGTLGGGNHFVELDIDEEGNHYLVIHSGGGNLPHDVYKYYRNKYKDENVITGSDRQDYLHDVSVCVEFAKLNRKLMSRYICERLDLEIVDEFDCVHHYFDTKKNIARHGATSAEKGERVIIPINMKDGCILATGKGNPEWNYSAPHGAGRIMSRRDARQTFSMDEYLAETDGLFSTTVNETTLDESPMAYKRIEEITRYIEDTVTIDKIIKPIFNFKP